MGVDHENLDGDADMSGGVVQSDAAAEDAGREARKRAVSIYFDYIHGYFSTGSFPPAPTLIAGRVFAYMAFHLDSWLLS